MKVSLLGLTGYSRDLSPRSQTLKVQKERGEREKGLLPSWGGPCAGGGGAGRVRDWGSWTGCGKPGQLGALPRE